PPPAAEPQQPAAPPEPAAGAEIVDLAQSRADKQAEAAAAEPPEAAVSEPAPAVEGPSAPGAFARRGIVPAGQPLPPQPSANEVSAEALATVREVEKKARRLSLLELTERTCKWPVGDPATEEFWFCGLPTQPGKPYCEAHVAVAFQPMSARRDRRR
ncbi:MAG: GcrA cell cycle regulator, partial [Rhodobacteraceae bacterium]|nr:GcrA cell cycle regulator [Paracoccaceae bacterium]